MQFQKTLIILYRILTLLSETFSLGILKFLQANSKSIFNAFI